MASTFNIGDDSNLAGDDLVQLAFEENDQPTVKNNGPNVVNYYVSDAPDENSPDGTIAVNGSHQFLTPPAYLSSAGATSVTVTSSVGQGAY